MARYTKTGTPNTIGELNSQLDLIATAIGDTLSRKGDAPNQMEASLDMNSYNILNLPYPASLQSPVRLVDINGIGDIKTGNISDYLNADASNFGEALLTVANNFETVSFQGLTLSTNDAITIPATARSRKWFLNGASLTFTHSELSFNNPMELIDLGGGEIVGGLKLARISEETAINTKTLKVYSGHSFVVGDFMNCSLDIYNLPNATDRAGYVVNGDYNRITSIVNNGDGTDTVVLTYNFLIPSVDASAALLAAGYPAEATPGTTPNFPVASGVAKHAWMGNGSFNKNGMLFNAGGNIRIENGTLRNFQGYVIGIDDGYGVLRQSVLNMKNMRIVNTFLDIFRARLKGLIFDNVYVGRTYDFAKQNIFCDMPQDTGFIVFKNGCHFERQNADGEIYNRPFDTSVLYPLGEMGNLEIDDTCTFDGTGTTDIVNTSTAPLLTGVTGSFSGNVLTFATDTQFYVKANQAFDVTGSTSNNGRYTVVSVVKAITGWTTSITVLETFTAEAGATFNVVGALYWGVNVSISGALHFYVAGSSFIKLGSTAVGASKFKGYERSLLGSTFNARRWYEQGTVTFTGTTMSCEPIYVGTTSPYQAMYNGTFSGNSLTFDAVSGFYIEVGQVLEITGTPSNNGSHTVTGVTLVGNTITGFTFKDAVVTETDAAFVVYNNSSSLTTQDRVQKYVINTTNCYIQSNGLSNYNGGCYHYDEGSTIELTEERKDTPLLNGSSNFSFVHKTGGSLNGRYLINTMETTLVNVRVPYTDNPNNIVLFREAVLSNPNSNHLILMPPLDDKFNGTGLPLNDWFATLPNNKWFGSNVTATSPNPPQVNFRIFGGSQNYSFGSASGFTVPYTKTSILPRNADTPFQTIGKYSAVYREGDMFHDQATRKDVKVNSSEQFTALTAGVVSVTTTVQVSSTPTASVNFKWVGIWSSAFQVMNYLKVESVVGDVITFSPATLYAWAIGDEISLISASSAVDNRDAPNTQTGAAYSLLAKDTNRTVIMTSASANTVAIGADSFALMPTDSVIMIMQEGAGVTTIDADAGATLNGVAGGSTTISGQYMGATLIKRSANTWVITGAIAVVA